jgi:hypothetical protein
MDVAILGDCQKHDLCYRIKSVNNQNKVRFRVTWSVMDFSEWKFWGYPVGDTALQRYYEWWTAANYVPYFKGNPIGSLSDKHQPQIFRTRTICGDIITS